METWTIITLIAIIIIIVILVIVAIYLYSRRIRTTALSSVLYGSLISVGISGLSTDGKEATDAAMQQFASETNTVAIPVTLVGPDIEHDNTTSGYLTMAVQRTPPMDKPNGYDFAPGADTFGYNIARRTDLAGKLADIGAECSKLDSCVAFNHLGELKSVAYTDGLQDHPIEWPLNSTNGLYVRKYNTRVGSTSQVSPTYAFQPNLDMIGYDYTSRADLANNPTALMAACDADAKCMGVNTDGALRRILYDFKYMPKWKFGQSGAGIYTKTSAIIRKPAVLLFTNDSGIIDESTVALRSGTATIGPDAKYIQIPRYMGVYLMKNENGRQTAAPFYGFMRGKLVGWVGASITVHFLHK